MGPYFAVISTRLHRSPLEAARLPGTVSPYCWASTNTWPSPWRASTAVYTVPSLRKATCSCSRVLTPPFSMLLDSLKAWRLHNQSTPALSKTPHMPIRVGCCFGECIQLQTGEGWVGRGGVDLARPVAEAAGLDEFYTTGNVLDVADLPLYDFEEMGSQTLQGDLLPHRTLYQVTGFNEAAPASRSERAPTRRDLAA